MFSLPQGLQYLRPKDPTLAMITTTSASGPSSGMGHQAPNPKLLAFSILSNSSLAYHHLHLRRLHQTQTRLRTRDVLLKPPRPFRVVNRLMRHLSRLPGVLCRRKGNRLRRVRRPSVLLRVIAEFPLFVRPGIGLRQENSLPRQARIE